MGELGACRRHTSAQTVGKRANRSPEPEIRFSGSSTAQQKVEGWPFTVNWS